MPKEKKIKPFFWDTLYKGYIGQTCLEQGNIYDWFPLKRETMTKWKIADDIYYRSGKDHPV